MYYHPQEKRGQKIACGKLFKFSQLDRVGEGKRRVKIIGDSSEGTP